jgi:hypothetical protein
VPQLAQLAADARTEHLDATTDYGWSVLYYGDWLARHERSHLTHMARILEELRQAARG